MHGALDVSRSGRAGRCSRGLGGIAVGGEQTTARLFLLYGLHLRRQLSVHQCCEVFCCLPV